MLLSLSNYWVPEKYTLDLKIQGDRPNFHGHCAIDLVPGGNTASQKFQLHATKLIVTKAVLFEGGNEVAQIKPTRGSDSVSFEFPQETSNSRSLRLELDYLAVQTKVSSMATPTTGVFKSSSGIWATHCQPGWASSVFPCVDEPVCRAKIQLTITTDDPEYTCIANMPLADTKVSQESCSFVFQESLPMPTHLFAFVLGKLQMLTKKAGDITVNVYAENTKGLECVLSTASAATTRIGDLLNVEYPIPKIDIVALPFLSDGAMENWSLITVAGQHLIYTSGDADSKWNSSKSVREIVVHELVHQWLGDLCSFKSWDNTWFNESFATWMGIRVLESMDQTGLWQTHLDHDLVQLLQIDSHVQNSPVIGNHQTNDSPSYIGETFDPKTYSKGIYLLEMLSSFVGFETFCGYVGEFISKNKCMSISTLDFWLFLKEKTAFDVPTMVNSWVRNKGFPILLVTANDGKCTIEQHRYLDSASIEDTNEEDVPFHIPLILVQEGQLVKKVLTDRRVVLDTIPDSVIAPKLALLLYRDPIFAERLNGDQIFKLCFDLNFVADIYRTKVDLEIFKRIADSLKSKWHTREGLKYLQLLMQLSNSITVGSSRQGTEKLQKWIESLDLQFNLEDTELSETKRISFESNALCGLFGLSQGKNVKELLELFDSIVKGSASVPLCYASLAFVAVAIHGDIKRYNTLLSLTDDDNLILKTLDSIQKEGRQRSEILKSLTTQIVQSLGFTRSADSLRKLLAHILARLKKGKEDQYHLCFEQLSGGLAATSEVRRMVWEWFRTNYRTLLKNGDRSKDFMVLATSCFNCNTFEVSGELDKELKTFIKKNDSLVLRKSLEHSRSELKAHQGVYELAKGVFW
ncbi:unnamed protein product [Kuraishia capsulata CBS 1993]|uniref:Aminopeptidase n=1 Tax=Kuraishia capsulata CBS 1993 TaxID=1382522 RepID=W6MI14_9ASCO|nr:uncharacterized protein KUCA_T00001980001 [Kuraishia capsulata CBS 1993]CDK26009.1 unnamed protein product [Kuraishia capsulata CBS 1993]